MCNTNLMESGAVIQSMQGKQPSSLLTEINGRLHQGYRTLSGSVATMQQVKVTRIGPNGQALTAATAKQMLTAVFQQLKQLHEVTNIAKNMR